MKIEVTKAANVSELGMVSPGTVLEVGVDCTYKTANTLVAAGCAKAKKSPGRPKKEPAPENKVEETPPENKGFTTQSVVK